MEEIVIKKKACLRCFCFFGETNKYCTEKSLA